MAFKFLGVKPLTFEEWAKQAEPNGTYVGYLANFRLGALLETADFWSDYRLFNADNLIAKYPEIMEGKSISENFVKLLRVSAGETK